MTVPEHLKLRIMTVVEVDMYELECMKAELGDAEFKRLISEELTSKLIKEIERRI